MEEWKPVAEYEGMYEVSSLGNVRSLERTVVRSDGRVTTVRQKEIRPVLNADGYYQCKLCRNNKHVTKRVHQLVAYAFIPNPNGLAEINHKDSNRQNNCVENLEWINHKDNVHQSIKEGHHVCTRNLFGANNPNYGNTKLKSYYAQHPEEKMRMSRPGARNGRARPIAMYDCNRNFVAQFEYVGECAQYMIDNNITNSKIRSIRGNIRVAINEGRTYHNFYFEFI